MEKYVERALETKIRKYIKRKEIIAIVGPRQCGKTTLMKHIFKRLKNAKFISFDDQGTLQLFNNDIKLFTKRHIEDTDYLFIDEFQYSKDGGKQLKFIYDNYKTKIFISGSSAAELSIHSIKYLVGRIFVLNLYPFSFEEFLKYKDIKIYDSLSENKISDFLIMEINKIYEEYCVFGGYPEVVLSDDREEKIEIIKNIYNTYLLREIREILQISEDFRLIKLIKALALQAGNLVNYSELSSLTGFSYVEMIRYLNILKKTFICFESRPFFTNKRKELAKAPKIYFLDLGFRNFAINNFQDLDSRNDAGNINENFVGSEIFKTGLQVNFWRTKAGAEIDFVIEKENNKIPIEVKTSLSGIKYGKSFKNFITDYAPRESYILSKSYCDDIILAKARVKFRPIFLISKILKKI